MEAHITCQVCKQDVIVQNLTEAYDKAMISHKQRMLDDPDYAEASEKGVMIVCTDCYLNYSNSEKQ